MRSLLAVVAGYLTISVGVALLFSAWFSVPSHSVTQGFMVFAVLFGLAMAILGGYVTAAIAPGAPLGHGIALALVSALLWGLYTLQGQTEPVEPLWFQLSNGVSVVGGVLLGAGLRSRQVSPAGDEASDG